MPPRAVCEILKRSPSIALVPLNSRFLSALSTAGPSPPPPPISSAANARDDQHQRGIWWKLLLFIPGAATFALGTWQLFRRKEKIEMIDYRMTRLGMDPIIWNNIAPAERNADSLEFRRVLCEGVFDESKSIYVGPRSRSISGVTENGFYVVTPLIPTHSDTGSMQQPVLVNRGWVPRSWKDKPPEGRREVEEHTSLETRNTFNNQEQSWWKFWSMKGTAPKIKGPIIIPIRVTGVVRGSEKPSIFVPENDPRGGQWFYIDVPMIARSCNLPEDIIFVEDTDNDSSAVNPYPAPKDMNTLIRHSVMPPDHLNYAITWYSLSAAVIFMAIKRIKPKRTRRKYI